MLNLINLDARVRHYMLEEVSLDIKNGTLYISKRLSPQGRSEYESLLKRAIQYHNDDWLAVQLSRPGWMNDNAPANAPQILAEGEFNRFYIRGVCRAAIEDERNYVLVYRAKRVTSPRRRSQKLVGKLLSAKNLLQDLRKNPGRDTWFGVPAGVFSGISVCLPGRICAEI